MAANINENEQTSGSRGGDQGVGVTSTFHEVFSHLFAIWGCECQGITFDMLNLVKTTKAVSKVKAI